MIVSLTLVRNEDWVLALSARALMMWVDHAVFLDHCSTDESPRILAELAEEYHGRVTVLNETSPVWEEMRHRQRTLDTARQLGATHCCIVDADEVLSGDLLPTIHEMVYACPANATMQLPWLCLRGSKDLVHRSGVWGEQNVSMGFMDSPGLGWNAAERGTYDFHQRAPMGRAFSGYRPVTGRESGMMHLQFLDDDRLRKKQAFYKIQEVLRWPGRETVEQLNRKYNLAVYGDVKPSEVAATLSQVPDSWWAAYSGLLHHLKPQEPAWQGQAIADAIKEHGLERFAGLDLFGTA